MEDNTIKTEEQLQDDATAKQNELNDKKALAEASKKGDDLDKQFKTIRRNSDEMIALIKLQAQLAKNSIPEETERTREKVAQKIDHAEEESKLKALISHDKAVMKQNRKARDEELSHLSKVTNPYDNKEKNYNQLALEGLNNYSKQVNAQNDLEEDLDYTLNNAIPAITDLTRKQSNEAIDLAIKQTHEDLDLKTKNKIALEKFKANMKINSVSKLYSDAYRDAMKQGQDIQKVNALFSSIADTEFLDNYATMMSLKAEDLWHTKREFRDWWYRGTTGFDPIGGGKTAFEFVTALGKGLGSIVPFVLDLVDNAGVGLKFWDKTTWSDSYKKMINETVWVHSLLNEIEPYKDDFFAKYVNPAFAAQIVTETFLGSIGIGAIGRLAISGIKNARNASQLLRISQSTALTRLQSAENALYQQLNFYRSLGNAAKVKETENMISAVRSAKNYFKGLNPNTVLTKDNIAASLANVDKGLKSVHNGVNGLLSPSRIQSLRQAINGFGPGGIAGTLGIGLLYMSKVGEVLGEKGQSGWWNLSLAEHMAVLAATSVDIVGSMAITEGAVSAGHYVTPSKWKRFWGDHLDVRPSDGTFKGYMKNLGKWGAATAIDGALIEGPGEALQDYFSMQAESGWKYPDILSMMMTNAGSVAFAEENDQLKQSFWGGLVGGTLTSAAITPIQTHKLDDGIGGDDSQEYTPNSVNGSEFDDLGTNVDVDDDGNPPPSGTNATISSYKETVEDLNNAKPTVLDENGNIVETDLGGAKDNNADAIATLEKDINKTNEEIQKTQKEVDDAKEQYNKVKDDPSKQAEAVSAADTVKEAEEKLNDLYEHKKENQELLDSYRSLDEQTTSLHAATLAKDKASQKKDGVTDEQFNAAIDKIANAKNNEERAEAIKEFTNDIIDLTAADEKAMTGKINAIKGRDPNTPLGEKDNSAEAENESNDNDAESSEEVDTGENSDEEVSKSEEENNDDSDDDDNGGGGGVNSSSDTNTKNTGKNRTKKESKESNDDAKKEKSESKEKKSEPKRKPRKHRNVRDEMNDIDDSIALMSILGANAQKNNSSAQAANKFVDDNFDIVEIDSLNDVSMDGSVVTDARNKKYRWTSPEEKGMKIPNESEADDTGLRVMQNSTQIVSVSRYLVVYDENGEKHTYDTRRSENFADKVRNTGKRARELLHDDIQGLLEGIIKDLNSLAGKKKKPTKKDVKEIKDKVISLRENIDKKLDGLIALTDLIKFIVGTNPNSEVAKSMAILAQNVAIRIDELDRQSKELVRQCKEFDIDIKTNKPAKPIDTTSRISSFAVRLKNIMGGIFEGVTNQINEAFEERPLEVHSSQEEDSNGQWLSNLTERGAFTFKFQGKEYTFRSVEHAYQTLKSGKFDPVAYASGSKKPRGRFQADKNTNYQLIVDLIKASFTNIVDKDKKKEVAERLKSNNYFKGFKFTHSVNDVFWRTAFPKALREALDDLTPENKKQSREETFSRLGKLFQYISRFLEPLGEIFDASHNAKIELLKNNLAMINHAGLNGLSFNNPYAPLTLDPTTTQGIFALTQDMVQNFFSFKDIVSVTRTIVNAMFKAGAFDTKTFHESSALMGHFSNVKINFHPGYWNSATKEQLEASKDIKTVEVSVADLINLPTSKISSLFTLKQIKQAIKIYNKSEKNNWEIDENIKSIDDLEEADIDLLRETLKEQFVRPALFARESTDNKIGTYNSTLVGLIEDAVVNNKEFLNDVTNIVRAGIIVKAHTLMNTEAFGLENGDLMFNLSYIEANEKQKLFDLLGLKREELTEQQQHDIWSLANFGANTWLSTLVDPRQLVDSANRKKGNNTKFEKQVYKVKNERETIYHSDGSVEYRDSNHMRVFVDPTFLRNMKKRYNESLNKIFHDLTDDPFKDISNKPFGFNKNEFREKSLVALSRKAHHIVIDPKTKKNKVAEYFRTMFGVNIDEVMDEILSRPPVTAAEISEKRNRIIKEAKNNNQTVKDILNNDDFVNEDNPFLYIPMHTYEKLPNGRYVQVTKYYYAPNLLSNPKVRKQLGSENIDKYFGDFYSAKFGYFFRRAADIASVLYIYGNYRLNTSKKPENKEKFAVFEGDIDFSKPVFVKHRLMESTRAFVKNQIVNPSNKIIRDLTSYRSNNQEIVSITADSDHEYKPTDAQLLSSKNHKHRDVLSFLKDEKTFNGAFYAFMQIFGKDVDKLQISEKGKKQIKATINDLRKGKTDKKSAEKKIRDILSKEVKYNIAYEYKYKGVKTREVDLLNDVFIPLLTHHQDSKEFKSAKTIYDRLCKQYSAENMSIWDDHPALSMNNKEIFDKFLETKKIQDLDTSALQVYIDGAQTGVFENMVRFQGIAEMDILSNVYRGNLANLKFKINKKGELEFSDKGIDDTDEILRRISLLTPREATDVMTKYNELIQSLEYEGSELYYAESLKRDVDPYILTMALMLNQMSKFKGNGSNLFINLAIKGNLLTRDAMKKIVLPYLYGSGTAAIYNTILAQSLEAINSNMYSFIEEFVNSPEYENMMNEASSKNENKIKGSKYLPKLGGDSLEKAKQIAFRSFLIRKGMGVSATDVNDTITLDEARTIIDLSNEFTDDAKKLVNSYLDLLQSFNPNIHIKLVESSEDSIGSWQGDQGAVPGTDTLKISMALLSNPVELMQTLSHELNHSVFNFNQKTIFSDDANLLVTEETLKSSNDPNLKRFNTIKARRVARIAESRKLLRDNFKKWYDLLPESQKNSRTISSLKNVLVDFLDTIENSGPNDEFWETVKHNAANYLIANADLLSNLGSKIDNPEKFLEVFIEKSIDSLITKKPDIGDTVFIAEAIYEALPKHQRDEDTIKYVYGIIGPQIKDIFTKVGNYNGTDILQINFKDSILLDGTGFETLEDYASYLSDPMEMAAWLLTNSDAANRFVPFLQQKPKEDEQSKSEDKKTPKSKKSKKDETISPLDQLINIMREDVLDQIAIAEIAISLDNTKSEQEKNIKIEELRSAADNIKNNDIGSLTLSNKNSNVRKANISKERRFAAIFGMWLYNNPDQNTEKLLKGVFSGKDTKDVQSVDYGRLSANIFGTNNVQLFEDIGKGKDLPSSIIEGTLFSEEMQDIDDYTRFFQITNKVSEMYFDDTFKQYWKPITNILKQNSTYQHFHKDLSDYKERLTNGEPMDWGAQIVYKTNDSGVSIIDEEATPADAIILREIKYIAKRLTDNIKDEKFKQKRKNEIEQELKMVVENTQKAYNYSGEFLPSHIPAAELSVPPDIRMTRRSAALAASMKANVESIVEENMALTLDNAISKFFKERKGIDIYSSEYTDAEIKELVTSALTDKEFADDLIDLIYNERQAYYEKLLEKTYSNAKEQLRTTLKASNIDSDLKAHIDEVSEKVYKKIYNEQRKALTLINTTDKKSINRENIVLFIEGKFPKTTTVSRTDLFAMPNVLGLFNHNLEAAVMAEMCATLGIDTQVYDGWITNSNAAVDSIGMWNKLFAEMHDGVIDIPTFLGTIVDTSNELAGRQNITNPNNQPIGFEKFLIASLGYLVTISNKQPVVTKNIRTADTLSNTENTERFDPEQEYDFVFKRLVQVVGLLIESSANRTVPLPGGEGRLGNELYNAISVYAAQLARGTSEDAKKNVPNEAIAERLIKEYGNYYTDKYIAEFNESLHSNEGNIFFEPNIAEVKEINNAINKINPILKPINLNEIYGGHTRTKTLSYVDIEDVLYVKLKPNLNSKDLDKNFDVKDGISKKDSIFYNLLKKAYNSLNGDNATVEQFVNRVISLYMNQIFIKAVESDTDLKQDQKDAIIKALNQDSLKNNMMQTMKGNWLSYRIKFEYNGKYNNYDITYDINDKNDAEFLKELSIQRGLALRFALKIANKNDIEDIKGVIQRQYKEAATLGMTPVYYVGKNNFSINEMNNINPAEMNFFSSIMLSDGKTIIPLQDNVDGYHLSEIIGNIFELSKIRDSINEQEKLKETIVDLKKTYAEIMLDNEARRAASDIETTPPTVNAESQNSIISNASKETRLSDNLLSSLKERGAQIKIVASNETGKKGQTNKDIAMTEVADIVVGFSNEPLFRTNKKELTGTGANIERAKLANKAAISIERTGKKVKATSNFKKNGRSVSNISTIIKEFASRKENGEPVTIFLSGSSNIDSNGVFANHIRDYVKKLSDYASKNNINIRIVIGDAPGVDTIMLQELVDTYVDLSDVTVYSIVGNPTTNVKKTSSKTTTTAPQGKHQVSRTNDKNIINNTKAVNVDPREVPKELYYAGNIDLLSSKYNNKRVAIIGTRGNKAKGKSIYSFPKYIANRIANFVNSLKNDAIIVSGLAKGADFTAMNAAVNSGKKVIAILPCSPNANNWFLDSAAHQLIDKIIANGGLVISENNGSTADAKNLISRDRLQAYYASKVLLTASDIRTGTDRGSMYAMNAAAKWKIPTAVFSRPEGNTDALYNMNDYFAPNSQILGNTAASEDITAAEAQRLIDEAQEMTPEEFIEDLKRRRDEDLSDPSLTNTEKAAIKESYDTMISLFENAGQLNVRLSKERHEAKGLQVTNHRTRESSILLFANNDRNTALHEYIHSLMNFALGVNSNNVNILKDRIYYIMQQVKEALEKNPALMSRLGITKEQFEYIFNNPNGINSSIQEFVATFLSTPKLAAWLKTQQFTPGKDRWTNVNNAKTLIGKAINFFKALLSSISDLIGSVMLSNKKNLHNMMLETTKQLSRYNTKEGIEKMRTAYQNHPLTIGNKVIKATFHLVTGNVFKTAVRYLEERGLSEDYIDQFRQEILNDINHMKEPLTAVIAAMESDKSMSTKRKVLLASIALLKFIWRAKSLIFSNPVKRHFVISALNEYRQQLFEGTWLDIRWPIDLGIRLDKQFDDIRRNVDKITNLQNAMSIEEEASAVAIRDEVKNIILSSALPNLKRYVEKRWNGDTTRYEQSISRFIWFAKISDFFYGQKEIDKNELLDIVNRALNPDKSIIAKNRAEVKQYINEIMDIIESNSTLNPDLKKRFRYFIAKGVQDLAFTRLSRKHNTIGLSNVEQMIYIMDTVTNNWAEGNNSNERLMFGQTEEENAANREKIIQALHKCVTLNTINLIHDPYHKNVKAIKHIKKDTDILVSMYKDGDENMKKEIIHMLSLVTQIHHDSEARNNQIRVLDQEAAAQHFRDGKDITDEVYEGKVYKTEGALGRGTAHPYYTEGYVPFARKPDDAFIVRLEVTDPNFERAYNYYKGLGFEDFEFSDSHEGGLYSNVKFLKYKGNINFAKNRSEIGYRFTDRLAMGHHQEFFISPKQESDPESSIPNYWDFVYGSYMRTENLEFDENGDLTGNTIARNPEKLDLNEFYGDKRISSVGDPGSRIRRDNIDLYNLEELTEYDYTLSNLFYNQEKKIFQNNTSNFVNTNVMNTILDSQESIKKRAQGKNSKHHHAFPMFRIVYKTIPTRSGEYVEAERLEVVDPVGLEMQYGIRFNRDDLANLAKLMKARGMFENLSNDETDDSRIVYVDTRTIDFLFGYNKNLFNKDVYGDQKHNPALQKKISAAFTFLRGLVKETRNNTIIRNPNLVLENFKSNIIGLFGEGIPPSEIFGSIPVVIRQLNQYQKLYQDAKKLETQIAARRSTGASNFEEANKNLQQINRELSEHPLYDFMKEGGFYTNIVEDSEVTRWKWDQALINKFADKIGMSEQSKNYLNEAVLSEDSEAYKALAYWTRLGDFVPRVIYANHLIEREGLSKKEAIVQARDRFVNYNTPIWSPVLRNMDFFAMINYAKYGLSMQRQSLEAFAKSPIQVGAVLGAGMAARAMGVPKQLAPTSYLGESVLFGDSLPSGIINGGLDRMFASSFRHYYMLDSFGLI